MNPFEPRRNPLAAWYESVRRPSLVLIALVLLMYGRSLGWGFILDDCRHLDVMEHYHRGDRDHLQLYRFLRSDESNQQARRAGTYPWWLSGDLRYQHWRPVSEWLLYGQFLLFERSAWGYRAAGLLLYAAGVLLVLSFFRLLGGHERPARWGALAFALLAGHAAPVIFISAQSDLLALALGGGAMCMAARYARGAAPESLLAMCVCYALALGSKEACLPLAVLPATFALIHWPRPGGRRRCMIAAGLLSAIGLFWFACYAAGGFGANNAMMLNPLRAPLDYLANLPGRAALLLTSLLIPINPFIFYLRPRGEPWLLMYGGLGLALLCAFVLVVWRRLRDVRGALPMALWALPFMPLLACTVPDDRVMVLPSIGFAFLLGLWMTLPGPGGSTRLRRLPLAVVGINAAFALAGAQVVRFIETDAKAAFERAAEGFARSLAPGDCVFFINAAQDWRVLFADPCFRDHIHAPGVRAAYLSDAERPEVIRTDARTLRLRAPGEPFFCGYLGRMAESRDYPKRPGDQFDAGEFTGTIIDVSERGVCEIEVRFRRPLEDDAYRFYWAEPSGDLTAWSVPPPASLAALVGRLTAVDLGRIRATNDDRWTKNCRRDHRLGACIGSRGSFDAAGAGIPSNCSAGAPLTTRAGTPTTVVIGSTSSMTTAPAPTIASSPIRTR